MRLAELVDNYLFDVARRHSPACELKYRQILHKMLDSIGDKTPVEEVTRMDVEAFLDRWRTAAPATKGLHTTIVNKCFEHAVEIGVRDEWKPIKRPKLPKPEDRDVVVVPLSEIPRMFAACLDWGDEVCLGVLAYAGPRRNAVSMLRWRDVDLRSHPRAPFGLIKVREKGGKVALKPIAGPLREILDRAPVHGPDDYVVPNYKPHLVRRPERKNSIIYDRVKRIAARAGVSAHVHALRAAFAVFFLEVHHGSLRALQELLGHESSETTRHYTRGLKREVLMSEVVDMDWGALTGADERGLPSERDRTPAVAGPASVPVSALSEGELESAAGSHPELRYPAPSESASETSRQPVGSDRLAARHLLPPNPEEAHTGFEPVLLGNTDGLGVWREDDIVGDRRCRFAHDATRHTT